MKRVLVLMATYNGAKYLSEQINSVLSQTGVEVTIYVSDDCSSDGTVDILENYTKMFSNIHYRINEQNIGYRLNFWKLIKDSNDAFDYYAFCDQDDVWLPNKLEEAVSKMGKMENDIPIAYFSNLTLVNESLKAIGLMNEEKDIRKQTPLSLLLQNKATGCTLVINGCLKKKLTDFPEEFVIGPHDEIIARVAVMYGDYIYDERSFIWYRQHGGNVIGTKKEKTTKKAFEIAFGKRRLHHSKSIRLIRSFYGKCSSDIIEHYVSQIVKYREDYGCRMNLFFSRKMKKTTLKENFFYKLSILFKKY